MVETNVDGYVIVEMNVEYVVRIVEYFGCISIVNGTMPGIGGRYAVPAGNVGGCG